jgi:EmrB/QacA subfamily drug resistance transporter
MRPEIVPVIVTIMLSLTEDRRRWVALGVVLLAFLMTVLDATVVNVALPQIGSDLGFSQAHLTWVVNAYLVSYGAFLLVAGRLGDLIGHRRVFLVGVAAFAVASLAAGLAQDGTVLVLARFAQGIAGALAAAAVLAILVAEFTEPAARARAMSLYILVGVSGGSLGLLAGGLLTDALSWHWIFFINLPIAVVALVLGRALIEDTSAPGAGGRVDVLGAVLITTALMVAVYAIVQAADHGWASARTLGLGGVALALLGAFAALEARLAEPILPPRILRLRSLMNMSVVRAITFTGMYSAFFFGALYLQRVLGYDALHTGLGFLPMTLTVATLSTGITTGLVARFGARQVLLFGLTSMIAGLLLLSRLDAGASYVPGPLLAFFLLGLGAGTSFAPVLTIAMAEVPRRDAGLASGIINVSGQVAAALGLAVLGTISTSHAHALARAGDSGAAALTGGYHLAFVIAAGCLAVGILVALVALRGPTRGSEVAVEVRAEAAG